MTEQAVTILTLDDADAWTAAVAPGGMPGHGWAYARGLAETGIAPQLAVVRAGGARMVLPFFERGGPGARDIATLPGLSGLRITPDSAAPLALWRDHACAQGWVCGYLQLSARNAGLADSPGDRIVAHNVLYEFDLDHWDIDSALRKNARRRLKAGERAGARLVDDPDRLRPAFLRLYPETMARLGARSVFPPAVLTRWFQDPDLLFYGAEVAGQVQLLVLGRRLGPEAELHLTASTPEGRGLQAWLWAQLAEACRARGIRHLNIGGHLRPGDGIDFMKSQFGLAVHPLRSVRQVYDPARFAALCAAAGADPDDAYFPPWRRPAA
ncbi:MAG: GNAT family N-acetyltransferase [Rhodobacterales bacterium]|nr:GNAT family N-acetyltransferase [Rhodobacterales bacterium]